MKVEMYTNNTWSTQEVDIPNKTDLDKIEEVARKKALKKLTKRKDIAFVGVYYFHNDEE
jgi:PDZ domain-containing secreted protein